MDPRQFHKQLFDAAQDLIPAGACLVVAVSGGPDSMALLHGLTAVNAIYHRCWSMHIGHVDHRLRPQSAADAQFVAQTAKRLSLPCTIKSADVPEIARRNRQSVEEAGRQQRYRLLEEIAERINAGVVAVAHHADDQAETVLHRVARGTGLGGLAGMTRRRPIREGSVIELVRPLLGFRGVELRAYLAGQGIAVCHDASNEDVSISTRNRIRRQVLPLLAEAVNPEVATALNRLAEQARTIQEALTLLAQESLNRIRIYQDEQGMVLSAAGFAALPRAIRSELLMLVLRSLGVSLQAIDFERIKAASQAADGRRDHPRRIELPGGAAVEHRGGELRVTRTAQPGVSVPEPPA